MILGSDGSEQNANICLYWLKFRRKSTGLSQDELNVEQQAIKTWLTLNPLFSEKEHVTCNDNGDNDEQICEHISLILLHRKG